MTRQEKYEKQDVEVVLEKLFHAEIEDENGTIFIEKDPPFPWEDAKCEKLKTDHGFAYLTWLLKDEECAYLFEECDGNITDLSLKDFSKYFSDNANKINKWLEEYDDVRLRFSGDSNYPHVIYIAGLRKETDEEYKARIEVIEKRKMRREASLSNAKKRKIQKKIDAEKALLEKLKKKYESN